MNHSVLTLNILHGLRGACDGDKVLYEEAEAMFFRWLDLKESSLAAEAKTLDWLSISYLMHKLYPFAKKNYIFGQYVFTEEVQASLHEFIRKRYEVYARSLTH